MFPQRLLWHPEPPNVRLVVAALANKLSSFHSSPRTSTRRWRSRKQLARLHGHHTSQAVVRLPSPVRHRLMSFMCIFICLLMTASPPGSSLHPSCWKAFPLTSRTKLSQRVAAVSNWGWGTETEEEGEEEKGDEEDDFIYKIDFFFQNRKTKTNHYYNKFKCERFKKNLEIALFKTPTI